MIVTPFNFKLLTLAASSDAICGEEDPQGKDGKPLHVRVGDSRPASRSEGLRPEQRPICQLNQQGSAKSVIRLSNSASKNHVTHVIPRAIVSTYKATAYCYIH